MRPFEEILVSAEALMAGRIDTSQFRRVVAETLEQVRQQEREACAKFLDDFADKEGRRKSNPDDSGALVLGLAATEIVHGRHQEQKGQP